MKLNNIFPTKGYDGNGFEGYEENLACQCQGNPLFPQIHSGAQVAEICLPANRRQYILIFCVLKEHGC